MYIYQSILFYILGFKFNPSNEKEAAEIVTNFVVQLTAIVVLEPAHHMLASFVEVRIVGLKSLTNPGV